MSTLKNPNVQDALMSSASSTLQENSPTSSMTAMESESMTEADYYVMSLRLTIEDKHKLDAIARSLGFKTSVIIKRYLQEGIARHGKKLLSHDEKAMIRLHIETLHYVKALAESLGEDTLTHIKQSVREKYNAFIEEYDEPRR